MSILSVDLAYKTYRDIGAVVMERDGKEVTVELLPIPLDGAPSPGQLAGFLADYCCQRRIRLLLLDGPQAWKAVDNGLVHSRLCERQLNTPAKTGLPGSVKPANYRPFVEFSIAVFDALAGLDWRRLSAAHAPLAGFTSIESFPLSAWRVLGLKGLSAKSKATLVHIEGCRHELARLLPLRFYGIPSHDELQATVAGLAGLALEAADWGKNLGSDFLF